MPNPDTSPGSMTHDSNDRTTPPATSNRSGYLSIALIVVTGLAATYWVFKNLAQAELARVTDEFHTHVEVHVRTLQKELDTFFRPLKLISNQFMLSKTVLEQRGFSQFVESMPVSSHPAIRTLGWIPRVKEAERSGFEEQAERQGSAFRIMERDIAGRPRPASGRNEYYPILFAEPSAPVGYALGFDLASDPLSRKAIQHAAESGNPVATEQLLISDMDKKRTGLMVFMPVYHEGVDPGSALERKNKLQGLVFGLFIMDAIDQEVMKTLVPTGFVMHIFDDSAPPGKKLLHTHSMRGHLPPTPVAASHSHITPYRKTVNVAGRQWSFVGTPIAGYFLPNLLPARMVLFSGLVLTTMLGLYLLTLVRRNTRSANLASNLIRVNRTLENEMTERRRADAALAESESRFRGLVESSSDWIWEVDAYGVYTYASPKVRDLLGYDPEELIGKTPFDLMTPGERRRAGSLFEEVAGRQEPFYSIENANLHKDGRIVVLETSAVPVFDADHVFKGYRGIDHDITRRKEREEKLSRTTRALGAIHASNILLTRSSNEKQLLEGVCKTIVQQAGYRFAWIGFAGHDEAGDKLQVAHAGDEQSYIYALEMCQHATEELGSPAATAISSGNPCIIEDIAGSSDATAWCSEARRHGFGCVIAFPLMSDKKAFGSLLIYSAERQAFTDEEVDLLAELAGDLAYGVTALRTQKKHRKAEEQIAHQAFHDSLTGLPNRAMVMQSLSHAIAQIRRHGGSAAVIFIDLDEFKLLNDTLGHEAGNELLRHVGKRLRETVRETDIVARQGGDEFIVLMARHGSAEIKSPQERVGIEAATVAQRIIDMMKSPWRIQGQESYVGASIGISIYPEDAGDAHSLLQHADSAMYRAKELGRRNCQFYSRDLSERQHKRLAMVNCLHRAIEQELFTLYYQPIVDLMLGCLTGVEALIRLQMEDGKLLSPEEFMPVAEDTGMIIPIGDWVLNEACRQIRCWLEKGIRLQVAVNLSVRQCSHGDIAAKVLDMVTATGIPREALKLEITESAMSIDPERMEAILRRFDMEGFGISLDDFGTGYSSLNRLKQLPIKTLKIDKSFVDGIPYNEDDTAIVTATAQLAKNLGMHSLAEGIESAGQWRFLRDLGCEFGQGYYFSRPVPAAKIEAMAERKQSWSLESSAEPFAESAA